MIRLRNITKTYSSRLGPQTVFNNLSFDVPTDKNLAILGKNGAGKSTLFRMLAKSDYPDKGTIETDSKLSWPVALQTGIHPLMTGRENTRFIGRVNGVKSVKDFESRVQEFAELKNKFDLPVKTYSSGMRAKLVFACCLNIDFDIYLIDEATSVGDPTFKKKAKAAMLSKRHTANIIMISHDLKEIREFCDSGIVLSNGQLCYYPDVEDAIEEYMKPA
jgi:capsular polysaccharide transport system ATP-binding protein